jgi:mycobactin phenyloxazoline synthetase
VGGAAGDPAVVGTEVAELLGVPGGTIEPGADLVGHGLDSIRMMSLAGRWRRRGLDIDFAALAAEPTIAAWSALLSTAAPVTPAGSATTTDTDTGSFPLAPMQHAMWVGRADDVALGGVAGHLYVEFDLEHDRATIDPDRLRSAATALAARHPMLRVEFLADGTQRIGPAGAGVLVAVQDLRDLDAPAVEQRLAKTRTAKSHQQLGGAVFELTLSRLPDGSSRLHVDLDMQAGDAMSYRILMADLAALYRNRDLPGLGYTYREYRTQTAERHPDDAHRRWWAQRIPELPDPPWLPRPVGMPHDRRRTSRRWHWLDPATRDALFGHARSRGVTPAMALASSFANTLARWSAEARFLLNVPLFGREPLHAHVDRLVGDFTSSLLLDIDLSHASTATARAHAVQDAMRAAAAHASYPGLSVLRDLSRYRGTQVLAPVVFTSALGLGELFGSEVTDTFGTPVWIISQGPQVMLDAQVTEFNGGLLVNWDVREEMFTHGVIDAMFDHHVDELLRLAGAADAWDTAGPAALPDQQRQVRDAINAHIADASGEALHHGFFLRADEQPDAPAVYWRSGDLSYTQLRDQALAVAAALRDRGVRPGDTVALLGPKNAEQIPALLGILAAGGAYMPIGADQPPDRAERILAVGEARAVLVTDVELSERPELSVPAVTVRDAVRKGTSGFEFDPAATDPAALAYVLFTSGSTGEPKGVEVTHDAVMNTVEFLTRRFGFGPTDRSLALLTPEADMSVLDVFAILRTGGAIVMVDEAQRRDPDTWVGLIEAHRVTVLNVMPGSLEMLLEVAERKSAPPTPPSLRVVLTGGDWVRPELARRLHTHAPGLRFAGLGGATETAVHATLCETTAPPAEWTAVPYGTPFPNLACRVVNTADSHLPDRPDWVPGELWVSGRGIARGYRGRRHLTAAQFVRYQGRTWYRTGDLARYWPDGTLEFVGRTDHQAKISGYRVELGEVETALRRVPGVATAVAAMVPAASAHGDADRLAAVVRSNDPSLTPAQILAGLTDYVPAQMIPRHLSLVENIPYTASGKIDRRAVTSQLTADMDSGQREPTYRNPATPLQAALAAIIGTVLGVGGVCVDDDFFALGGDSVLATAAATRIRTWLDTPDVLVPDIFATRTVAALADRLVAREPDAGRLDQVAEVYLEVAQLDAAAVLAALAEPG